MKRAIFPLILTLAALSAKAQTDSISMSEKTHELQEVVVESDVARTSARRSVYLPTKQQRNAATDATSLLRHMMIPELSVSPTGESVTTAAGEGVAILIDFVPASADDLKGMNTRDVNRVELLDFPTDQRFRGAKHVVNFIMQQYDFGGYTKLNTRQTVLTDYSQNSFVYSKFNYKRLTFDLNLADNFSTSRHLGSETTALYNLPARPDAERIIQRNETTHDALFRQHEPSVSLRIAYNTDKIQLSNTLSLHHINTPHSDAKGTVLYSPSLIDGSLSDSRNTSRGNTLTYLGEWFFPLPKGWGLSVAPQLQFVSNKRDRRYAEGNAQPIENQIDEIASMEMLQVALQKMFGFRHSLFFGLNILNQNSRMNYHGSTETTQKVGFLFALPTASYTYFTEKTTLSAYLGLEYLQNRANGTTEELLKPSVSLSAKFSPSQKHSLSASLGYMPNIATGADRNESMMKTNELLYYTGNPALRNGSSYNALLTYTWLPSNRFSAAALASLNLHQDYVADLYEPFNDGQSLLRRKANCGDFTETQIGTNLTARLLKNNLQIQLQPALHFYSLSGDYTDRLTSFRLTTAATYYIKQFHIQAYFDAHTRSLQTDSNVRLSDRSAYGLTAGWGNSRWNIQAQLRNPFRTSWRDCKTTLQTTLYNSTTTHFNLNSHQRLNLTVTYTFNYGKKLDHDNEIDAATSGGSSIL